MKIFEHDGGCNSYCHGTIHAVILLTDQGDTEEDVRNLVEPYGMIFLSARRALEIDLDTLKAKVTTLTTITEEGTLEHRDHHGWPVGEEPEVWMAIVDVKNTLCP